MGFLHNTGHSVRRTPVLSMGMDDVSAQYARREAVRALKRFIARAIWRRWRDCVGTVEVVPASLAA